MTTPAHGGESNVVYPNFGGATTGDDKTFEWPDHVDWSEIAPDDAPSTEAHDPSANQASEATVIEFPTESEEP